MVKKRLFLIDGSGLIFRAFFAILHLSTAAGHPTNATYGFTMMLRKIVTDYAPTHIAVAFDTKEKTFRHEIYDQYKANRPEPPAELVPQFADIHRVVDAHGIVKLAIPGFEADDIIGTLSARAVKDGFDEVVIVTGDKDFCQLVNEKVTLLDTKKDEITDITKVKERFGAEPKGVIDALALSGDTSDNIPGVPGVGEKTAKKLLEDFGTLEGIYENLDQIKGKLKEKLAENRDKADLARRLVTIDLAVPMEIRWDDFLARKPDPQALESLFSEFEFKTLVAEVAKPKTTIDRSLYRLVLTEEELDALVAELSASREFAVDTETTSTDPMRATLVGMSFCCDAQVAYYLPVAHSYLGVPRQLSAATALARLRPVLEDGSIGKVGHNIKYDYMVLRNAGVALQGVAFDTMLASYVLEPGRMSHSLDALALDLLGHKCIAFKDVTGAGKSQKTFDEVPLSAACEYAAEDAHVTWLLYDLLKKEMGEEKALSGLLHDIEMPLLFVLAEMETAGVKIDRDFFIGLHNEFQAQLGELETSIHSLAGHPFNLNSPKQVATVLFDEIGLKPVKKTKTGSSTDVEVLEELKETHEMPARLLEYRQVHKLLSTYVDTLPRLIHPKTGRIHGSFNQTVAATGRLSSSDPNLQNIPVRTEAGRRIRQGFIPEQGHVLLSADYSQIELRIMAHISDDDAMIGHFQSGEDIHRRTAAEVFGVMPGLVSKEQRSSAKAINFGILYGISAFRLGKDLGIGTRKAQHYIDAYFARYPKVKQYLDRTIETARESGYVTTLFGRRRRLPELRSNEPRTRAFGERMAYNTPIQGSAADLIKMAMVRVQHRIRSEKLPLTMLIQVHDELVFETPLDQAESMKALIVEQMENVHVLKVPLIVDAAYGNNWAEIH